ncbi:hypothetical protein D7W82_00715 [Corallococcus sp. CA049B]|uniref:hypothetical protein n=1 Tax=Corallococcus sp. CA049B TaxID=2316730 RepID=UPI000EA1FC47|nr:hypothetical protein [Corallococcus sp. CA049B]NOJ91659.1 hypothetical protein [Corallococcus coralloides]RKG91382.1 hypothetical protein D7W82_00715 [Corallococcus sp. CA049B]
MTFELLLAHADTCRPALHPGLDESALHSSPLTQSNPKPKRLWDALGDLDDLRAQRWGVVYPATPAGKRLLELIEPLRELRQQEQGGAPVRTYAVTPGMDWEEAHRWKARVLGSEQVEEPDRPRYLLVLGDLDEVSLELQQVLATDALVGRLAFANEEGYRAYVAKVLQRAEAPSPADRARLLFYTSRDGTDATELGYRKLVEPCLATCARHQRTGALRVEPPRSLADDGTAEGSSIGRFLAHAAGAEPAVLLSVSHGLGMREGGWLSAEDQRASQGALLLPGHERLTAAEVAARPFLPGGLWFCFACFSGGTPALSAYAPWLGDLHRDGAGRVTRLLPRPGERPFIAALPQAALANPEGPLAVVGHVDLAWSSSFNDQGRSRHERFLGVIKALASGRRAGAALSSLLRFANETSASLASSYHQEKAALTAGRQYSASLAERAHLWMLYHDLASHVLLGDPAVRLPLKHGGMR